MRVALAALTLVLASCGGLVSCSGDKEQESRVTLPDGASLIPVAAAPSPTPRPSAEPPSEDPLPATPPGGTGDGTSTGSCGAPVPPPISRINVHVYSSNADRVMLDSTPLVGPDVAYCRLIGYTDGRSFCPVRPDGHPERLACEAAGVGRATDTGRIGPTWSANGAPCNGSGGAGSCTNHPSNQFQVYTYGPGTFRACSQTGVCGEIVNP